MQPSGSGSGRDLAVQTREIIDANRYMTLATADGDGRPWAAPVWYAHEGYTDFLWVSRPETRHSRNLASRPELAVVIFDSSVPVGGAQAVYVEALAEELDGAERERWIAIYSRRSQADGAGQWRGADVIAPAPHRLYRAKVSQHFVLESNDRRIPVQLNPRSAATNDTDPTVSDSRGTGPLGPRLRSVSAPADTQDP